MTVRIVVIGVGNPYRSDDGAGPEVARRVRDRVEGSVEVLEHDGEASGLLDLWEGADLVFVIDAVHSHAAVAGHVHRVEVGANPSVPPERGTSTHGIGPGDAVALGKALDRLPRRLVLYGIEGATFATGVGLSAQVECSVGDVVSRVAAEVMTASRRP